MPSSTSTPERAPAARPRRSRPIALDLLLRFLALVYLVFQFVVVGLSTVPGLWVVRAAWRTGSVPLVGLALGVGYLLFGFTYLLLVVAIKRLVAFRSRPGDYPFLSTYVLRWAFVGSLVGLAKSLILCHLQGMPVLNAFYRAMGAHVGRNVIINTCQVFDFDALEIGDDVFIGGSAVVIAHAGEAGVLKVRPVRIGRGCTVGQSSIVFPGSTMEDGSVLGALSFLPKGRTLPAGTRWGGNPLRELPPAAAATADQGVPV